MANKIQLHINDNSKDLGEENYDKLFDLSYNGIEMFPKMEGFPMPWDAVCYIEGDMFIIDGDIGQQGAHKAYAKVGIPVNKVMKYLDLILFVEDKDESEVRLILQEYGWL